MVEMERGEQLKGEGRQPLAQCLVGCDRGEGTGDGGTGLLCIPFATSCASIYFQNGKLRK